MRELSRRESNELQDDLISLSRFTDDKLLRIKEKKTQVMKFNFAKNHDFPPELEIKHFREMVEVTSDTKLLGLILTNDLKWERNIDCICAKAFKKMWTIRRMKVLDVDPHILLDVYIQETRSVLELAVPAWHSGFTKKQAASIERVQRVAVSIILSDSVTGQCDFSYDMALVMLEIEPLKDRREKLCKNFANKTLKSRHADIFTPNPKNHYTRSKPGFQIKKCNSKRCYNSPLNYLTRMLNSDS